MRAWLTVVGSEALQRAWLVPVAGQVASPPPLARATLVTLGTAAAATATVRVIGLPDAPAAMTVVLVQVTTWPAAEQVQPVPVPDTKVRPAGNVSTMVMVPEVGAVPVVLLTVSV